MTIAEMKTRLQAITGFATKVTYYQWPVKKAPALPYLCFFVPEINNFGADNKVYYSANHFIIELYSDFKDPTTEQLVEDALSDFYYTKTEVYIDDEKLYQVLYELEV